MKFALILIAICSATSANLEDDFSDIFALFPVQEMRAIARTYLNSDFEFQRVVAYLQGPEWASLVAKVRENPTWKEFKAYLIEAGIDIEGVIRYIHDIIMGAKPENREREMEYSLRGFLDEIISIIPSERLEATVKDKMKNSKDFQGFYVTISSDESRKLFEEVAAMDEVLRVADVLKGMGVKVDAIVTFIYDFLGWK